MAKKKKSSRRAKSARRVPKSRTYSSKNATYKLVAVSTHIRKRKGKRKAAKRKGKKARGGWSFMGRGGAF